MVPSAFSVTLSNLMLFQTFLDPVGREIKNIISLDIVR